MVRQEVVDLIENMPFDEMVCFYDCLRCVVGQTTIEEVKAAHPQYLAMVDIVGSRVCDRDSFASNC